MSLFPGLPDAGQETEVWDEGPQEDAEPVLQRDLRLQEREFDGAMIPCLPLLVLVELASKEFEHFEENSSDALV